MTLYEHLAIGDIQDAADVLRPVYDATERRGRLCQPRSLALSGERHRGDDRRGAAAVGAVDRPNLMIKVPGTAAGAAGDPRR